MIKKTISNNEYIKIQNYPWLYRFLKEEHKNDRELAKLAIKASPSNLKLVHDDFKNDAAFVKNIIIELKYSKIKNKYSLIKELLENIEDTLVHDTAFIEYLIKSIPTQRLGAKVINHIHQDKKLFLMFCKKAIIEVDIGFTFNKPVSISRNEEFNTLLSQLNQYKQSCYKTHALNTLSNTLWIAPLLVSSGILLAGVAIPGIVGLILGFSAVLAAMIILPACWWAARKVDGLSLSSLRKVNTEGNGLIRVIDECLAKMNAECDTDNNHSVADQGFGDHAASFWNKKEKADEPQADVESGLAAKA